MPITDFYNKYSPDFKLHFKQASIPNLNDKIFLDELISYSLENLKCIEFAPNVEYNLPEEMYSEFNNELKSNLINQKDHESEFYDLTSLNKKENNNNNDS